MRRNTHNQRDREQNTGEGRRVTARGKEKGREGERMCAHTGQVKPYPWKSHL